MSQVSNNDSSLEISKTNKIFRYTYFIISLLFTVLYLAFSYNQTQFGEDVGENKAQIIHSITAIGFLLACFRINSIKLKFPHVDDSPSTGLDSPISVSSSISNQEEYEEVSNRPGFLTFFIGILGTFELYLFFIPIYLYLTRGIALNMDIVIFSLILPVFTIMLECSIDFLENPKL